MPPGGGVDIYARLVQRHIEQHLPGKPSIVAQNMPGAGSLRAVQSLAASPDDGTVILTFSSSLVTESILSPERVKVDFRSFAFLGNVAEDSFDFLTTTTMAQALTGLRSVLGGGARA